MLLCPTYFSVISLYFIELDIKGNARPFLSAAASNVTFFAH